MRDALAFAEQSCRSKAYPPRRLQKRRRTGKRHHWNTWEAQNESGTYEQLMIPVR